MSDGADTPESPDIESANDGTAQRSSWADRRRDRASSRPAGLGGSIWFIGWLFTIGYAELSYLKAFFALFIWPYYLGETLRLATGS